jgi:hypothetical protein
MRLSIGEVPANKNDLHPNRVKVIHQKRPLPTKVKVSLNNVTLPTKPRLVRPVMTTLSNQATPL